jgi:MFS family permease
MQRTSSGGGLFVLYFSMLVTRIGFGAVIVLLPVYIPGAGAVTIGVALALYPLLEAITATPLGRLCDLRGRRTVFLLSLLAMAAMTAMIGLTRDIYVISVVHAFEGVAAAGITVSSLTMITDLTDTGHRGAGMGLFDFANIGGYAFGFLLGSRLFEAFQHDLGVSFFVTAGAMALAALVSFPILKEPPHVVNRNASLNPLKAIDARTRSLLPLWLGVTILLGIVFYLPKALNRIGIRASSTGLLLFAAVAVVGLGSVGFGALSDRIGRQKVMVMGVAGLLGLLVSLALLSRGRFFAESLVRYWYIVGPLGILATALVPAILAVLGDRSVVHSRGYAMGLYSMMLSLGLAIGNVLGGVADAMGGLSYVLMVGAFVFFAACLVSLSLMYQLRGNASRPAEEASGGSAAQPNAPP